MGGTCSNTEEIQHIQTHQKRLVDYSYDDEEKELNQNNNNNNNGNDKQEIDAMAKEVILLSTRNANLEQELDETNKKITKLRQQIDKNLDILNKNNLSIDILKFCKILNITSNDINNILLSKDDENQNMNDNILYDILQIESNDNDKSKYFDKFNDNQQLYNLLNYLKNQNDLKNLNKIIIICLYKSYYIDNDEYDGNNINNNTEQAQELKDIYDFCVENLKNISTQIIDEIHEIIKQEMNLQKRYEKDLFLK